MPVPVVPATGPVVLPDGRTLATYDLREFAVGPAAVKDLDLQTVLESWSGAQLVLRVAERDGMILCRRPLSGVLDDEWSFYPTFGMDLETTDALAYADAASIAIVDPYDADGEPIPYEGGDLRRYAADRVGQVASD